MLQGYFFRVFRAAVGSTEADRQQGSAWIREMPVQLLSRQDDPVGNGGKGVQAAKKQLDAAWMKDVTLHLIPGTRHIVLDERGSGG